MLAFHESCIFFIEFRHLPFPIANKILRQIATIITKPTILLFKHLGLGSADHNIARQLTITQQMKKKKNSKQIAYCETFTVVA